MTDDKRQRELREQKVHEGGTPEDYYQLGLLHSLGLGGPVNKLKACELYTIAAEKGHAHAQAGLGTLLLRGEGGVVKNEEKAKYWLMVAATEGIELAEKNLQVILHNEMVRSNHPIVQNIRELEELNQPPGKAHYSGNCRYDNRRFGQWEGYEGGFCSIKCWRAWNKL